MNLLRPAGPICTALIFVFLFPAWGAKPPAVPINLNSEVTILESPQAPGPVRLATNDLLSDFNKVTGSTPRLVNSLEETGPVSIVIGQGSELPSGVKCTVAQG